ncbi:MAG TPA: hypothetical protein VII47_06995 [Actinomycetota bacterium]|jgi:hypothetical protein
MEERPVAWTAMPPGIPVFEAGGTSIGTTESPLGDVARDIFHGVVVKRRSDGGLVEVLADHIERITTARVRTSLTSGDVDALPIYEGEVGGLQGLIQKVADRLETT